MGGPDPQPILELKLLLTGFVWTIATGQLVMKGYLSGRPTECRYCRYPAPKGRCHGNHLWLSSNGVHIGATWQIWLNRQCAAAMQPYVKLFWPLVIIKPHCSTSWMQPTATAATNAVASSVSL